MAIKLDSKKVRMGSFIRVYNINPKNNAKKYYYAIKLEDRLDNEFWCLFTSKEVAAINPVVLDDGIRHKLGHLYARHKIGKTWRSFVAIIPPKCPGPAVEQQVDGFTESIMVVMTDSVIKRTRDRAEKNQEDIPSMNFIQDLLD